MGYVYSTIFRFDIVFVNFYVLSVFLCKLHVLHYKNSYMGGRIFAYISFSLIKIAIFKTALTHTSRPYCVLTATLLRPRTQHSRHGRSRDAART